MKHWLVVVGLLCACGGKKDETPAAGSGSAPAKGSGSSAATSPETGSGSAAAPSRMIKPTPKVEAARCGEPCLFLLDTPIAQLADTYKAKCGGMETKNLGFDDCKQMDYARNCIYAAHGLVYKKTKWKKIFSAKPWYDPDTSVDAKKITFGDTEHANIHELYERGKACHKNLKISGADYERIKKWFGALPKSPVPAYAFHWQSYGEGEVEYTNSPKDFIDFLDDKDLKLKKKIAAGEGLWASYDEPGQLDKKLLDAAKIADASKIRSISVTIELAHGTEEEPYTEQMEMRFLYDDKDELVAITADHLAMD